MEQTQSLLISFKCKFFFGNKWFFKKIGSFEAAKLNGNGDLRQAGSA